jgi:hypothetical protein
MEASNILKQALKVKQNHPTLLILKKESDAQQNPALVY